MERRNLNRIPMPGAKVRLRRLSGLGVFNVLSKPADVVDISKSGISFRITESLESGQPVQIHLNFPDGKSFNLKGEIRWLKEEHESQGMRIGIQFLPFGSSRKYNPPKALDYLRNLAGQKAERIIRKADDDPDDAYPSE